VHREGWKSLEHSLLEFREWRNRVGARYRTKPIAVRVWLSFLWRYIVWSVVAWFWVWFILMVLGYLGIVGLFPNWIPTIVVVIAEFYVSYLSIKYALKHNQISDFHVVRDQPNPSFNPVAASTGNPLHPRS